MRPLALIGDSHIGAMKRAFDGTPGMAGRRKVHFHPFGPGGEAATAFFALSDEGTSVTTRAARWRNLTLDRDSFAGPTGQGAIIALSLPMNTSRVLRGFGWDRHVPWALRGEGDEIPLSDQAVLRIIEQDCGPSVAFARAVASLGLDVIVVEGPRFFAHATYVGRLRREVCREIDRRYRAHVGEALELSGIPVLRQPERTITPDGLTDEAFRHENPKDTHHANADYGRLVMAALIALAAQLDAGG
ncbi:hypothetical protein HKCCSP123_05735 [Rhodobacterales bacterium HKCCSP123]|nr:hypothetical protein [Rhodobacterales bacterium HKCCSP123]